MRTVRQRDGLPFAHAQRTWGEMTSYVSGGLKPMTVSGVKVTAAHYPAGSSGGTFTDGYLATYKKNGVTVNVQSEGLSRDEFCALVENLLAE